MRVGKAGVKVTTTLVIALLFGCGGGDAAREPAVETLVPPDDETRAKLASLNPEFPDEVDRIFELNGRGAIAPEADLSYEGYWALAFNDAAGGVDALVGGTVTADFNATANTVLLAFDAEDTSDPELTLGSEDTLTDLITPVAPTVSNGIYTGVVTGALSLVDDRTDGTLTGTHLVSTDLDGAMVGSTTFGSLRGTATLEGGDATDVIGLDGIFIADEKPAVP